jgi:hypothetical protein
MFNITRRAVECILNQTTTATLSYREYGMMKSKEGDRSNAKR